jgi:hypothetical protein
VTQTLDHFSEYQRTLDDWQRGFLDATFTAQGIVNPTPEQCSAAIKRMTSYVMQRHDGQIPADGRISLAVHRNSGSLSG